MRAKYIVPIQEAIDRAAVGGKAAYLGCLMRSGLPTPGGVVLTVDLLRTYLDHQGITPEVVVRARAAMPEPLHAVGAAISFGTWPTPILLVLEQAWRLVQPPLAVRSSATEEDCESRSFAGVFHTALGVRSFGEFLKAIRDCWLSTFSEAAIVYSQRSGIHLPLMAIALQAMVNSEAAGVAFIQDGEMTVEAVYGLACGLVSGSCAADSIVWSSRSGAPIIKTMRKEAAWLVNPCSHAVWHGQRVRFGYAFSRSLPLRILGSDPYQAILKCEVPEEMRDTPVLEETDVEKVGSCLYRVFDTFNRADLDIEWCLTTERDVSILQVRPTTAELPHSSISRAPPSEAIQGIAISPGVASGKAVVVSAAGDIPRVQRGSVVVVDHLDRALIGVLAKASALVTEETTVLSHHAIVAREWQVPCVGGIRKATISEGRVYLVDGTAGTLTPK